MGGGLKVMARTSSKEQQTGMNVMGGEPKEEQCSGPGLGDLPESCIAAILCLTTPRDVARVACACRAFRDASYSDVVWQLMLPPHYTDILAQAADPPSKSCSKKEIYDYLCNRVLLQNDTQEFWLDRATGGVCRSIGARGLNIVWGDDRRYWDWHIRDGSRFAEVAYLKQVCWFEINGELKCHLPPGTYTLSWRLFLADRPTQCRAFSRYAMGYVGGWRSKPVKFSLETSDNQSVNTQCYLTEERREGRTSEEQPGGQLQPLTRCGGDTWMEMDVGKFTVETGESPVGLQFSMIEIEGGNWKSGLYLDGIVIRPTSVKVKQQSSPIIEEPRDLDGTIETDEADGVAGIHIVQGEVDARSCRPRRLLRRRRLQRLFSRPQHTLGHLEEQ